LVFPWRTIDRDLLRNRWLEILGLCLALALVGGTMAGFYQSPMLKEWPHAYMILPVILWAVFRFNHLGTLVSLVIITLLSVGGAVLGNEVFPSEHPGFALFYLQMFLLIVSSVAWAVCGRVNELQILTNRLEDLVASRVVAQSETLRRREERLAVVAHDLQVPLIGIRNLVELLLKPNRVGADPERSRKLLSEIGEARVRDDIVRQVVEAQAGAHYLAQQLKIAEEAIKNAEAGYKLSIERKDRAVGVVLETLQSQQDLIQARMDYAQIVGDLNKAQYRLKIVTGE
jgi:signal transduction histidine kinase